MKPIPKRQHIVPALHLKHFTGPTPAGQVWTYDKITGKSWSATPDNTAVESHFYSVEKDDGTMDTAVEDFMAKCESTAAPIYEALVNGQIPKDQARADFAFFLALTYARTPSMRRVGAEIYSRTLQIHSYATARHDGAFNSLMRRFEEETGEKHDEESRAAARAAMLNPSNYIIEIPREITLKSLGVADKLTPILFDMNWTVVRAKTGYFISCDNPLYRWVDPKTRHPVMGDHGFLNKTAEVTFPLSPRTMLLMTWREMGANLLSGSRTAQDQNAARARTAERQLYAHIDDKRITRLAATHKNKRPQVSIGGLRPKRFAETRVPRRASSRLGRK